MRIIGFTFVSLTNTMDTHGRQVSSEYRKREGLTLSFCCKHIQESYKTCDKVTNYTGSSGSGGAITLPDKNTELLIHIVTLAVGSLLKIAPM